jgi:hypothetical protein
MRLNALAVAVAVFVLAAVSSADARPYDGSGWAEWESASVTTKHSEYADRSHRTKRQARRAYRELASYSPSSYSGGAGPRPRRWCGWWMRTQKGGGAHLNVAWNWSRWGSPSGPQVGAVVVWRHHVGIITGRAANGMWIVKSGNDGGRVRERARSVAGAVFRI